MQSCRAGLGAFEIEIKAGQFHVGRLGDFDVAFCAVDHVHIVAEALDQPSFVGSIHTIGGGFGKLVKLAQGALDLHSGRSQVDFAWLSERVPPEIAPSVAGANTARQVLMLCNEVEFNVGKLIADMALGTAKHTLRSSKIEPDIVIIDRKGGIVGRAE